MLPLSLPLVNSCGTCRITWQMMRGESSIKCLLQFPNRRKFQLHLINLRQVIFNVLGKSCVSFAPVPRPVLGNITAILLIQFWVLSHLVPITATVARDQIHRSIASCSIYTLHIQHGWKSTTLTPAIKTQGRNNCRSLQRNLSCTNLVELKKTWRTLLFFVFDTVQLIHTRPEICWITTECDL